MNRNAVIHHDTKAWKAQVWISFAVAASLAGIGLAYLPGQDLDRAFMFMGYGFCLSAAFMVAKYVRDNQGRRVDTPMWGMVVWGGFALAIGWLLSRNPWVIPIPGTRSPAHLAELAQGAAAPLAPDLIAAIETALPVGWAHGDRYSVPQWIGPERFC